jgi:L-iditol 2-dehydrogenase
MLEAVAVALHAVALTPVAPGSTAIVVGSGTVGLLILQALRVAGCSRLFVADLDKSRLALAEQLGATDVFCGHARDAFGWLSRVCGNAGADIAVEAVGLNDTIALAIASVRKGGAVTLVGNVTPEVTLPLQTVVTRQIRLQGSCASAGEYGRAIELVANGAIQVEPLISAVAPLEEGPRWFERLYAREPNLMKVVLTPEANS